MYMSCTTKCIEQQILEMTLELLVHLIYRHTKASKGLACPDVKNKDIIIV